MDQQRISQGPDGSYDLKDSHDFVYEALSKELYVGNVYLRVYNDQPDFEISSPEAFGVALVEFIAYLVHNQYFADSVSQDKPVTSESCSSQDEHNLCVSSPNSSEHLNDEASGSISQQNVLVDTMSASDGQGAEKEEALLVKNLQFGLTSLKVCC